MLQTEPSVVVMPVNQDCVNLLTYNCVIGSYRVFDASCQIDIVNKVIAK